MKYLFAAMMAFMSMGVGHGLWASPLDDVLGAHRDTILKGSRKSIEPAITALAESGLKSAEATLEIWRDKNMWYRASDDEFYYVEGADVFDLATGERVATFAKDEFIQIKPNSGIRAIISSALVGFHLNSTDQDKRLAAIQSIQRDPAPQHVSLLATSILEEPDSDLLRIKSQLLQILTIQYGATPQQRIAAIEAVSGSLSLDIRAALNPILTSELKLGVAVPESANLVQILAPGTDGFPVETAYGMLVKEKLAAPIPTTAEILSALEAKIDVARVGNVPVAQLSDPTKRLEAYDALAQQGLAPTRPSDAEILSAVNNYVFYEQYLEDDAAVTQAAENALRSIETKVNLFRAVDLGMDALSLASIYFLAAIGLAITFGVMGVINMAHGEFIMMGAYTGYVIQKIIPDHTISIIVAVPVAFAVTFAAGVAMERLVIRWLYNRPLETLLATFGISIALQQIAKNIFGTQARPLTSPDWLGGSWVINDVVSISYIRIAIFALALLFFAMFLFVIKKTRLGLETRAVTQNPAMAAAMGINHDRVNMLTFGLGSGIAGIAGVAIGLFAKVTSEMGNDYIVQSFMSVVVGGVGNIWGALAGATLVGFMQKGIEWFNPSNTLAAQTYMILFIIIFIQFRPKGIIALKGRAAGD